MSARRPLHMPPRLLTLRGLAEVCVPVALSALVVACPLSFNRVDCVLDGDCAAGSFCGGDGLCTSASEQDAGELGPRDGGVGVPDSGLPLSDGGAPIDKDGGPPDADAGPTCLDPDGDTFGTNCAPGPDCSEGDPLTHTTLVGYEDGDLDGFTVGDELTLCTDGTLPFGYAAAPSAVDDCNDEDVTVFANIELFVDDDNDTFTVGGPQLQCIGAVPPLGLTADQSPLADCDDTNSGIGTSADTDTDGVPDCLDDDDDGDGLTDELELQGVPLGFFTDPLNPDTDADGVVDGQDAAPTVAACSTEVLFFDTFTTGTNAWTFNIGSWWEWDQTNGRLVSDTGVEGAAAWIGERSWTDYVFQVTMIPRSSGGDSGVLFRAQNLRVSNNGGQQYYGGIQLGSGRFLFAEMDDGYTSLQEPNVDASINTAHTIRIELEGTTIRGFVDDAELFSRNDSRYASGSIGLRTFRNPAEFDDVIVCR